MTVTLDLKPDIEQELLAQARERGVSLDNYIQEIVSRQVRDTVTPGVRSKILKLPARHLGNIGPLHRRDIYDDAR